MLFDLIFLSLFFVGWSFCAFLPWLGVSVATRGDAGLGMLPLCLFAGIVAALAVPLLVHDGWAGVWLSFAAAFCASGALIGVRRFAADAPGLGAEGTIPASPSGRDSALPGGEGNAPRRSSTERRP